MKEIDLGALSLLEDEIVHDVVRFSKSFNRKIRQDPLINWGYRLST